MITESLGSRKDCQDVSEKICYIASHFLKKVSPGHQLVYFGKILSKIRVIRQSYSRCRSLLKIIRLEASIEKMSDLVESH